MSMHSAAEQWHLLTLDLKDLEDDEELLTTIGGRAYLIKPASEAAIKLHMEDPNTMSTPSTRLREAEDDRLFVFDAEEFVGTFKRREDITEHFRKESTEKDIWIYPGSIDVFLAYPVDFTLSIGTSEEDDEPEVPAHMREDGMILARLEAQFDTHTDPEGGDLYSDADNPEMPCPLCGKYDDFCEVWGDCDGHGNATVSDDPPVNDDPPAL